MKSPEEKAIEFANRQATTLFRQARRKELPMASSLGWSTVKNIALRVFEQGGGAKAVREAILEHASQKCETKIDPVRLPRVIPSYVSGGRVSPKRRDY